MLDKFRETAITWDKANRKVYESLRVSAGDNKGRKLSVQVVNGGVIESLSGASLSLFWETKDKAHKGLDAFTAVDATKGEFEIYYTTGMLSNEGTLNANLVLVDASGRIVSEPFTITVFKGIDDDAIQSSDSFTALTEALAQVGTINNKADRDELLALESTFEQNKVSTDQQLQQIVDGQPLKPEMFEGTDLQRLQQMFDLAIAQQRPMELSRNYDITGGSIIVKKGQIPRIPLRVFGGGKITKLDEGYFFTSNFTESGDLTFEGIFFEGDFNNAVFDENDVKLIRIKTEGCFFYRINSIHKSNTYLQSISSDGDTVIGGNGAVFDFDGCYDVKINNILVEEHMGQLIKHRGQGTAHTEAISLSVKSSTLEGFKGTLPVIQLRNTFGFLLDDNYFESNLGGHVVFDEASIQRGVTISNNTHEGSKDVDALIVMGGNASSVLTSNNVAKNIAILDTRKTVGGFVQSTNDKRSLGSPTHFIGDPLRLYIYDTEINRMQNGVNLENQLSNSTFGSLEDWEGVNVDITNPIFQKGNILNVKSKGTVNNAFARHKLKNGVASGDRFILMLDSKSSALDPFQVFIVNAANGSTLGAVTLTPTKINEMEHFIVDVHINISSDTAHISLYPKLYNTSITGERDFYKVALYKTNKAYPLTSFDKYVGYSTHSTGMGVHKLDANGDGVADIPNGIKRPVLSGENVGYPFLDRSLGDKLIIWNGNQWKDVMGESV